MIKYIKSRISVKIFLLTMVILMAVSGVSYGFVTAFMPRSYSDSLNRTLAARAKQLAESLSGYTLENALSVMENSAVRISLEWFFLMKMVELSGSGMDLGMR